MPRPKNQDSSHGTKLLRLFAKLMVDGKQHYQSDLAQYLDCSAQTVGRLVGEIESFVGVNLEIGTDNRRRYYRLKSYSGRRTLGLDFEELRYLSICHDLAAPHLPKQISERVENTIFELSALMADPDFARRGEAQKKHIGFKPKGYIDYTTHFGRIERLISASAEKKVCLIKYKAKARKEPQIYFYAPGKIIMMNGALYVQGHRVSKDGGEKERPTVFAIHRIYEVTQTEKSFDFDATIDDEGAFGMKWHEPRKYIIRFEPEAADYVRERIWSEDQKLEELSGGALLLELSSVSEKELMAWIRSFGKSAKLIEPEGVTHG
ncbi:WYL domain-containing protein [Desulfobaculum senezii]